MNVVIGLGANLGDRPAMLREAVQRIARIANVKVVVRSRVFETSPIGGPPEQGDFLNAAILIAWLGAGDQNQSPSASSSASDLPASDPSASARALLRALLEIERDLGRVRDVINGPRTIDLDILWIDGGVVLNEPHLIVPHPRLHERAFALAPLLDVTPDAADPRTHAPYAAILQSLLARGDGVRVSAEIL